jgi:DNA gyrase subunit A
MDVRATGRTSMGVRGINLSDEDEVVAMQMCSQGEQILIVSANGLGKRTQMEEFTAQNRGGKGVKCYKITEKTGNVVGVKAVTDEDQLLMITTEGIIIQLRMQDISTLGRITSGVKMMNLDEGIVIAQIAKVRTPIEEDEVVSEEGTEETMEEKPEI